MDQRLGLLAAWADERIQSMGFTRRAEQGLVPVSGDASFRRYFRAYGYRMGAEHSFILMDAPPDKESCDSYIHIGKAFEQMGLCVPHLFAHDRQLGFLLLSDLGDDLYLAHLSTPTADQMYSQALQALLRIQQCERLANELPLYDANLLITEMELFLEWFCERLLGVLLASEEKHLIDKVFSKLVHNALSQPQVCVHRDYHSRNLMVLPENNPGILDFQDAVKGAFTYDLVSLLKDCYIAWPQSDIDKWVIKFFHEVKKNHTVDFSEKQFFIWFDWMGLQRHLKVLGIFSRLHLRDKKSRYLNDIPLVLNYVLNVTEKYSEFSEFYSWLHAIVKPRWQAFFDQEIAPT